MAEALHRWIRRGPFDLESARRRPRNFRMGAHTHWCPLARCMHRRSFDRDRPVRTFHHWDGARSARCTGFGAGQCGCGPDVRQRLVGNEAGRAGRDRGACGCLSL